MIDKLDDIKKQLGELAKAWVHLDREFALAQARECDRSGSRSPIHAVPFAGCCA